MAEYEKLAKQLEKDLEEKANMHHINQYFDAPPGDVQVDADEGNSNLQRNHRFSVLQNNSNKFGQSAMAGGAA